MPKTWWWLANHHFRRNWLRYFKSVIPHFHFRGNCVFNSPHAPHPSTWFFRLSFPKYILNYSIKGHIFHTTNISQVRKCHIRHMSSNPYHHAVIFSDTCSRNMTSGPPALCRSRGPSRNLGADLNSRLWAVLCGVSGLSLPRQAEDGLAPVRRSVRIWCGAPSPR